MKMGKGIVLAGILLTLFLNGCTGGGKNDKIVVVSGRTVPGPEAPLLNFLALRKRTLPAIRQTGPPTKRLSLTVRRRS